MSKKLYLGDYIAIVISLLPALVIVGSEFWHAFVTRAYADYRYAGIGALIVCVTNILIYLPFIVKKNAYGKEYSVFNAFIWAFAGLSMVMMYYGGMQREVTGWVNLIPLYDAYIGVGLITLFFICVIIMFVLFD